MKPHFSARSVKSLTSTWSSTDGQVEQDSSSRTTYIGSSIVTTTTTTSFSERTPRSCSSALIKKIMNTGTRCTNKRPLVDDEMEKSSSMKSEVESSFVAGRSGEVCENSPVSCPPTPSNYTPISEHPVLDSVSSHVKELDNPSQNKTLANEQWSYTNNNNNNNHETPSLLKTQNSVQEAKQVVNLDTCKDRNLRGLNRRLPSPPRNESLTTLHQQNSEVFNELLEKKRQDLQNTNSSPQQDSQIFSSYSCQASSSIEAPLPVQDSPTSLWREAKTSLGGSNLVFIKPDSPHPRPRSVDSQIQPMTVLDESPSQVDRLRTEVGMFCSWDDDRECSSRVSNDVFSILLDRQSGLFQNSNTHRKDSGSLSPRLKLNLKSLQICPPKNHLLISFRETQVSLEEGIINTESEIFFDNDKTSDKVLLKKKDVFQTIEKGKQRAPELHRCLLPPPPPPQGEGLRPAASSRRGSIIKAMLHREKTLFPFCGCLGGFQNNTQNRN